MVLPVDPSVLSLKAAPLKVDPSVEVQHCPVQHHLVVSKEILLPLHLLVSAVADVVPVDAATVVPSFAAPVALLAATNVLLARC